MNPEIKAAWLHALRSGEFEQASGKLVRTTNGQTRYCCLGVLSALCMAEGKVTQTIGPSEPGNGPVTMFGDSVSQSQFSLPQAVADWAGIPISDMERQYNNTGAAYDEVPVADPVVPESAVREDSRYKPHMARTGGVPLSVLNDAGWTFAQIADLIEAHL